ncbi:MAG: spermidine/putrescine ABC transporter substrate-binding protein PotF [Macromonas sp.]
MQKQMLVLALAATVLAACGKKEEAPASSGAPAPAPATVPAEDKVVNVYNWPDYIAEDLVPNFEKASGLRVNYSTFENNEGLQAKLVAGNSGYDVVVPGAVFAHGQIQAELLQKLDKTQLKNYGNLDAAFMSKLQNIDPGNQYLIPWGWSFTTVGINKGKVVKALGNTPMPENAWDLVFNPAYTSKLKSCGIAYLDSPSEVIPPALHYLGKNAYSNDAADHKAAGDMLAKVRPDVRIFSSTMIDDLAAGRACVALGWAGDINIAAGRVKEAGNKDEIVALLPKTGGMLFIDTLAIPVDAKQPRNAHRFIDNFLQGEVSASVTNVVNYANGNKAAEAFVDPAIKANPSVFPSAEDMARMVPPGVISNEGRASMSEVYTQFKSGK